MFLKKIKIDKYKVLRDLEVCYTPRENRIYPLISVNGGGKSTLLQFVFAFLHCSFNRKRHQYLQNLLEHFSINLGKDEILKISEFEIEYNNKDIKLEFHIADINCESYNFTPYIELDRLQKITEVDEIRRKELRRIESIQKELLNSPESAFEVYKRIEKQVRLEDFQLLQEGNFKYEVLLEVIDNIKEDIMRNISSYFKITKQQQVIFDNLEQTENKLKIHGFEYCMLFNDNKNILLFQCNESKEVLEEISDNIYLATPNNQVIQFADKNIIQTLFTKKPQTSASYESHLKRIKKDLPGLFYYEYSLVESLLEIIQNASKYDTVSLFETDNYGNKLKELRDDLSNLLDNITITPSEDLSKIMYKLKSDGSEIFANDLSNGELKRLSIYSWLKTLQNKKAIVLMDEVDMGLHPMWQNELCNDLLKWSNAGQIILATHSPQIISNAKYKNIIVLSQDKDEKNGSKAYQIADIPLESDLNTIVKEIMGAEYLPKELKILRNSYRKLFESGKINSDEAIGIKQQIMEYESENSSFFQDIKFELEFE